MPYNVTLCHGQANTLYIHLPKCSCIVFNCIFHHLLIILIGFKQKHSSVIYIILSKIANMYFYHCFSAISSFHRFDTQLGCTEFALYRRQRKFRVKIFSAINFHGVKFSYLYVRLKKLLNVPIPCAEYFSVKHSSMMQISPNS